MRQHQTSKKNRTTYTYYDADGKKLMELVPGENGVTEADIAMLHEQDDMEYKAQRHEEYYAPVHLESYAPKDDQDMADRNPYLRDTESNPEVLLKALFPDERQVAIHEIWNTLLPQQKALVLKKLKGMSNLAIAAEEGITEAAIRNRWAKIQNRFKSFRKK